MQEGEGVEEGQVGSTQGGDGFEVEECEGVGPGDVHGWCHDQMKALR